METAINYWWALPILILLIITLVWMIRRNIKDGKDYEKEIIQSEIPASKHDEHRDEAP